MSIIHVMNTVFGRRAQYGARSSYIATSSDAFQSVKVFARGNDAASAVQNIEGVDIVKIPLRYQGLRVCSKIVRKPSLNRYAIWKGFDSVLSKHIAKESSSDPVLLHSWEWIPESLSALRDKHPGIKVIRDVVVNRQFEFYSGTPISEEDKHTDYFFSPSSYSTTRLTEWGVAPEKICEIPFGVDVNLFKPVEKSNDRPLRFSFSGGISKRKGVDSLLRVWKKLSLAHAELHLYGEVRKDVENDLKGAKNVFCHGFVPLVQELPQNDIFVFPSTLEGSAKSVYEALACGLPVITTPESGSVVRDGIDGFIVPAGQDAALAEAILNLYNNRDAYANFSRNARARAEEYTWDVYAHSIWSAYRKIISGTSLPYGEAHPQR